jgi:cold shock CspA family protein
MGKYGFVVPHSGEAIEGTVLFHSRQLMRLGLHNIAEGQEVEVVAVPNPSRQNKYVARDFRIVGAVLAIPPRASTTPSHGRLVRQPFEAVVDVVHTIRRRAFLSPVSGEIRAQISLGATAQILLGDFALMDAHRSLENLRRGMHLTVNSVHIVPQGVRVWELAKEAIHPATARAGANGKAHPEP